ncbi:MAG: type I restriction endonuclease [Myxococcota bacterium]
MSFVERIRTLAERAPSTVDHLATEEASKNALIMPFIAALGYDVFDPREVVPEFTADVGTKRGEKVDYAIRRDGEVVMLVEAKKAGEALSQENASQLFRYFTVTKARIAILTNGTEYRFYSDLEEPNKMDAKPFLVIDLLDLNENHLEELSRLTKEGYDLENMLSTAGDLKYMREIRRTLEEQFRDPDEEFVRFFFGRANPGARFHKGAKEQFQELVQRTFKNFVADRVGDRLRTALLQNDDGQAIRLQAETPPTSDTPAAGAPESDDEQSDSGIETTEAELQGFYIVKAIACAVLPGSRIAARDTKSYFGVLVDDNNRKPLCRLHFNRPQKYLGLFDVEKKETRHALESVDDIYRFAEQLREAAGRYVIDED